MHNIFPPRAIFQLLRFQAAARLRRTWSRFRGPRRLALSILAVLLACVWLGQVAASVLLREPADPRKLAVWIPTGLLAYTIWHLLKTACRPPTEPFEWTPAEVEFLGAAPLRRRDLVVYRLLAITTAAVAKAACFALVMWPDLRIWLAGFAGMILALLFVDLIRMAIEIVAFGMSRKELSCFRGAVLGLAAICAGIILAGALPLTSAAADGDLPTSFANGIRIFQSTLELRNTPVGAMASAPFEIFAGVILAPRYGTALWTLLLCSMAFVGVLAVTVVWLDQRMEQRRVAAERRAFPHLFPGNAGSHETRYHSQRGIRVPPRLRGVGALAWRQTLGAVHYRTSLCVAMVVPGVLSCLTLLTPHRGSMMLIQLVGGLVFYSFLLLPTAFKFDFRRDIDRLAVLKALPISATAVTLGQLAVPVLLCTLFQVLVLLIAMLVRPYHVGLLLTATILLAPTNVLIFSLENLIFLLYPYRLNQEGLGVFFRSILTFTGKGILFAVALGLALLWAIIARNITSQWFGSGNPWAGNTVFLTGTWLLITTAAICTTAMLVRVYRQFDPSQDAPTA